jgi:hypothetical protein
VRVIAKPFIERDAGNSRPDIEFPRIAHPLMLSNVGALHGFLYRFPIKRLRQAA